MALAEMLTKLTISYDEYSDLRLEVGEQSTAFLVCSKAMARSSPAFKVMLYGPFTEAKPKVGEWIVRLPEDDPRAFAILLDIIHGRSDRVPMDLHLAQPPPDCAATLLYDVVKMADKYCLLPLLRPWVNPWLAPWRAYGRRENDGWMGEIITAAWIVGDETLLVEQLDKAAISMRFRGVAYKGRGWVRNHRSREFRLGAMPEGPNEILDREGFSEMIFNTRARLVQDILGILKSFYSDPDREMPGVSLADRAMFVTTLVQHTALVCKLEKIKQPHFPGRSFTIADYKGSVGQLFCFVKHVQALFLEDAAYNPEANYYKLHVIQPTMERIEEIWLNRPLVHITDEHKAHLERRRKMTGVELVQDMD